MRIFLLVVFVYGLVQAEELDDFRADNPRMKDRMRESLVREVKRITDKVVTDGSYILSTDEYFKESFVVETLRDLGYQLTWEEDSDVLVRIIYPLQLLKEESTVEN